jgi:hypothetical protein
MHDVALIDRPDAGPAGDRRPDRGVVELNLGAFDRRLITFDGRLELAHQRILCVHALLGRKVAELGDPFQIEFCILELRLILGDGRLGLVERRLKRTRVDLGEDIARLDVLAFGKRDLVELPVHAGLDHDRVEGLNGPQPGQIDRDVLRRGCAAVDRNGCGHRPGHGRSGMVKDFPCRAAGCGDQRGQDQPEKRSTHGSPPLSLAAGRRRSASTTDLGVELSVEVGVRVDRALVAQHPRRQVLRPRLPMADRRGKRLLPDSRRAGHGLRGRRADAEEDSGDHGECRLKPQHGSSRLHCLRIRPNRSAHGDHPSARRKWLGVLPVALRKAAEKALVWP